MSCVLAFAFFVPPATFKCRQSIVTVMKEVDSRLAMVHASALLVLAVVLCALLVLSACLPPDGSENATTGKGGAAESGASKGSSVVSGKVPVNMSLKNVTTQVIINFTVGPCPVTPEMVKDACGFDVLPVAVGCSFDAGTPFGVVALESFNTTREGYALKWKAIPGTTIISEVEPFEATNEYQNIKYVWRFQGSTLVAVRATKTTCRLDSLRLLASMAMGGR